jgi:hypothetical protein
MLLDKNQAFYLIGQTTKNLIIESDSSHYDYKGNMFFIAKFDLCPPVASTIIGKNSACVGEKTSYSVAKISDTISYNWTVPDDVKIDSGQGTHKIYVTFGNKPGKITVIPNNVCDSNFKTTLPITMHPVQQISGYVYHKTDLCEGSEAKLVSNWPFKFTWSDGIENDKYFKLKSSSNYTITGYDQYGCLLSKQVFVDVIPKPKLKINVTPSDTVCFGTKISINGSGANLLLKIPRIMKSLVYRMVAETPFIN